VTWIISNIRWIMIASGVLTATMVYAAIAPEASLQAIFGETLTGPLADIIVRTWGTLIALIGVMLIYGAFNAPVRPVILTVAATSKVIFIALVLSHGERYLVRQAGIAVAIDFVIILLFFWYLLAVRREAKISPHAFTKAAKPQ
jgi:hypothetical protein